MDCCGAKAGNMKPGAAGNANAGINWVQVIALGMIFLLVLGFVLRR